MNGDRLERALKRILAAMERIDAACQHSLDTGDKPASGSARVVELVNVHEKLREQVAETLRELDSLLVKLEDER